MSARRTQASRSRESSRRLLDAAEELLAEGGYASATVAEIGRRAGYSRGLVTERFGSKDDLMWALVVRSTETWYAALISPDPTASGLDNIRSLLDGLAETIEGNSTRFRALQRLIVDAHHSPDLERLFHRSRAMMSRSIESLLRQGARDGSLRDDIDVEAEAESILACLRGIGYESFLYPDHVDPRGLCDLYMRQLECWLRPTGAPAGD